MKEKYEELDLEKLGSRLIGAAVATNHADVANVKYFVESYLDQPDDLESEYIFDVFTMKREDLINKWFGGQSNASGIALNNIL